MLKQDPKDGSQSWKKFEPGSITQVSEKSATSDYKPLLVMYRAPVVAAIAVVLNLLAVAAEGAVRTHVAEYPFERCPEGLAAILADEVQGSAVLRVA